MNLRITLLFAFAFIQFIFPTAVTADRILFIRGASGTVGFTEGGSDEQGAGIYNFLTTPHNHGWGELSAALTAEGFEMEEIVEGPKDPNGELVSSDDTAPYIWTIPTVEGGSNRLRARVTDNEGAVTLVEIEVNLIVRLDRADWKVTIASTAMEKSQERRLRRSTGTRARVGKRPKSRCRGSASGSISANAKVLTGSC